MLPNLSKQKPIVNSFYSNENFFPGLGFFKDSGLLSVKYQMKVPFSLERVVTTMSMSNLVELDPTIIDIKVLDKSVKNDRHQLVIKEVWSFPLLDLRTYECAMSANYEKDTFMACHKPFKGNHPWMTCVKDIVPSKKGGKPSEKSVYIVFDYFSLNAKKIDDDTTLITHVHMISLGGWGQNQFLFKFLAQERIPKWREGLLEKLNSCKDFDFKDNEDPYLNMFSLNCSKNKG